MIPAADWFYTEMEATIEDGENIGFMPVPWMSDDEGNPLTADGVEMPKNEDGTYRMRREDIDEDFRVTRVTMSDREKRIIDGIKKVVAKGDIAIIDFALYDSDVIFNAASILGIEHKVRELLDILTLHSIIEMDISIGAMLNYVDVYNFKRVYKSVERNIMEGKLENSREAIVDYLKCL